MSTEGILNQDDLNSLLSGLLPGGAADVPKAPGPEWEAARKVIRLLCDQASSVVTTVISKSVDFRPGSPLTGAEVASYTQELLAQGMEIDAKFDRDLKGVVKLVLEKRSVAILSDLMLMGSGDSPYNDEHKDAIQEIVSQIMGSASTTMKTELGLGCEIKSQPAVDLAANASPSENPLMVEIKLSIDGFPESKAWWIFDAEIMKSLASSKLVQSDAPAPTISSSSASSSAMPSASPSLSMPTPPPAAPAPSGVGAPPGFATAYGSTGNKALDLLMDIELPLTIELGRTQMSFKRILELGPGAIVEMERFAGEPVDILINGKVVAKGEVVVVDENFGVRLVALVTPEERIKMLR